MYEQMLATNGVIKPLKKLRSNGTAAFGVCYGRYATNIAFHFDSQGLSLICFQALPDGILYIRYSGIHVL